MEDQQPAAGDLTLDTHEHTAPTRPIPPTGKRRRHRLPPGKAPASECTTKAPTSFDAAPHACSSDQRLAVVGSETTEGGTLCGTETVVGESTSSPSTVVAPPKAGGRRQRRVGLAVAAGAAAIFVGAATYAGWALQPYLADRALVDTKLRIAHTAASVVTALWTYTPDDMASLPERSARYLGGDFATQYRRFVDSIAPTNKQTQITNSTQVVGVGVESVTDAHASALVYTNSTSMSPLTKNTPSVRYVSYRLELSRDDTRWLVTGMSAVTSLDLTPQI